MRGVHALLIKLRDRPKVVMYSPLSADETLARLQTGLLGTAVENLDTGRERVGRRIVFGRARGDEVRISIWSSGGRSMQKILRARCVATERGSALVGTFALDPIAELVLVVFLVGSLTAFILTVVGTVQGDGSWAWAGTWLGVFILVVMLVCLDRLFEDRDERFIKTWIDQRLQQPRETLGQVSD
jgi:hypothetical protein